MPGASSYPVLVQAHAVQTEVRDIIAKKARGEPLTEAEVSAWMDSRRKLASSEVRTPIDALAIAHGLLQGVECIPRVDDDREALVYLVEELTAATSGIIRFLEENTGVTRETLGLFDNYIGPPRH